MKLIAQHPYVKVERTVTRLEQFKTEHNRVIYLYEDKVVTQNREFPIHVVTDLSYRAIGNQGGLLYLHTMRGLYTYQVKTSPEAFIKAYQSFLNNER